MFILFIYQQYRENVSIVSIVCSQAVVWLVRGMMCAWGCMSSNFQCINKKKMIILFDILQILYISPIQMYMFLIKILKINFTAHRVSWSGLLDLLLGLVWSTNRSENYDREYHIITVPSGIGIFPVCNNNVSHLFGHIPRLYIHQIIFTFSPKVILRKASNK